MAKKSEEHLALIRYVLQLTDLPRFVYEDSTEAQLQDEVVKELARRNSYEVMAWFVNQHSGLFSPLEVDRTTLLVRLAAQLREDKPATFEAAVASQRKLEEAKRS